MTEAGYAPFRRKMVRLLLATRWPAASHTEELLERHARALGIAPELLREARDQLNAERARRGLKPLAGRKTNEIQYPQLEVNMPKRVWEDWHTLAERRAANPNALLRGLLHFYLMGTWEPKWLSSQWQYRGQLYKLNIRAWERDHRPATWPYREKAMVSPGALRALHFRARRSGQSAQAILRGLVLEALEGRILQIEPMDSRALYNDAERYMKQFEAP